MSRSPRAALGAALPLAAAGLTAVLAAACNNDVADPAPASGFVKVIHAVTNAGPVNVVADVATAPVIANLAAGAVGPSPNFQYLGLAPGQRTLQVVPASGTTPAISEQLQVESGRYYTVVAAGRVGGTGAQAPAFIVLPDSVTTDQATAPAPGQIRLRAVHAASTVGPVDIHAQLVGPALGATAAAPRNFSAATRVFPNVPFRGSGTAQVPAPVTGTATVAARNYDLCVIAAGVTPTANGSNCAILGSLPAATTGNGLTDAGARRARSVITVVARDPLPSSTAPGLIVTTDKPVQP